MNTRTRTAILAAFATLGAASADIACAQTVRQGGASAQTLMQLQQLANEKTVLQADVARLKGELEKASRERDSLKEAQQSIASRTRGVTAELATAVSDRARLEGELAQEKSRVQELIARLRETALVLKDIETRADTTSRSLAGRETELKTCVDRNQKLVALNEEVLRRFEDQGFWSAVAKREPFTQLKRVELENLADGYRDTARDNRVAPPKP